MMYKPILLIDERHVHTQGSGKEFYDTLGENLHPFIEYWDNLDDKIEIENGSVKLRFDLSDYVLVLIHHNYESDKVNKRVRSKIIRQLGDSRILFAGDGDTNVRTRRTSRGNLFTKLEPVLCFYKTTGILNDKILLDPSYMLHIPLIEKLKLLLKSSKEAFLNSPEFRIWIANAGYDPDKVRKNYESKTVADIENRLNGWMLKEIIWKL